VSRSYRGAGRSVFGTLGGRVSLPKPLKRPTQDRAKFTVRDTLRLGPVLGLTGRASRQERVGRRPRNGADEQTRPLGVEPPRRIIINAERFSSLRG
jgi:hypothetical protein